MNEFLLQIVHSVAENPAEYRYCYNSYAAAVTEVEVDVLTGEFQVLRVDILYDCGTRYITIIIYEQLRCMFRVLFEQEKLPPPPLIICDLPSPSFTTQSLNFKIHQFSCFIGEGYLPSCTHSPQLPYQQWLLRWHPSDHPLPQIFKP